MFKKSLTVVCLSASVFFVSAAANASEFLSSGNHANIHNVSASACIKNPQLKELVFSADDQTNGNATVILDCDAIRHMQSQGHHVDPNGADDSSVNTCFVNAVERGKKVVDTANKLGFQFNYNGTFAQAVWQRRASGAQKVNTLFVNNNGPWAGCAAA